MDYVLGLIVLAALVALVVVGPLRRREADWRTVNRELRGEAIVILRKLDSIEGREGTEPLP